MSRDDAQLALLTLLGIVLVAWTMCTDPTALADEPDRALDLARVSAGEAGLQTSSPDMGAIHYVLQDRARRMGVSYRVAARRYATRHFDRGRTDRRRWVAWLRRDGRRPEGWPRHLSWETHRDTWRDMLALAGQYVAGDLEPACRAHLWGDRHGDRRRALRLGLERVECGGARNLFWRVPWARPVDVGPS